MRIFANAVLVTLLFMFTSCAGITSGNSTLVGFDSVVEEDNIKQCKGEFVNDSEFLVSMIFTPIDKEGEPTGYARYYIWVKKKSTHTVAIIQDDYIITSQPEDTETGELGDLREAKLLLNGLEKCDFDVRFIIHDNRNEPDEGDEFEKYKEGDPRICIKIIEIPRR